MKFVFIIFLCCGCAESYSCLYDLSSDLGAYTAQELTRYEDQGCCRYNGGISSSVSCSGVLFCRDGSASTCQK